MSTSPRTQPRLAFALAAILLALLSASPSRAGLTEESIPAQEMPITLATPAATPLSTPGAAGEAPPMAVIATTPGIEGGPEIAAPPEEPAPPVAAIPEPSATASSAASADPGATPLGEPPPIDLDTLPTMPVSETPLTALIDNAPTPTRATSLRLTEQARQDISNGRAGEAIQALTSALSIDSSNPYAYFYLGRAYLLKKDYHQTLTFLQRAEIGFASDPTWLGEALSFEGVCDEQSGQTAQAAAAYRRALDSSPYNLMARTGYVRLAPPPITPPETGAAPDNGASPASDVGPPPESGAPPPPAVPPPPGAPPESNPLGPTQ
jgi:hypothetical protein